MAPFSGPGGATHAFSVTYTDDLGIDVSDIDSSDVRVTGPNGYDELAVLLGVDESADGTPRTATYRIPAPGGTWDIADDGTYSVSMQVDEVQTQTMLSSRSRVIPTPARLNSAREYSRALL